MPQEHILVNDIIADHRERMLNLKKYYPFFRLSEVSFSWFKDGACDCLDMGYILMAVLRFFIEENNFKERDVTYQEYAAFMSGCIRRDFALELSDSDMAVLTDYIFDKLKNDGKPFVFRYFDPVDRKKKVSRIKLLESRIADGTVWYSISSDGIEFYLDTKEIRDESRISVEQLLLEKMIRSKDFKGGTEVVKRINQEVDRLWLKKNQVMALLASDVFSGLEAYEEFFETGIKWFNEEQKLFNKNSELIAGALKKAESDRLSGDMSGYLFTAGEIYKLDTELKIAMNNHMKLLSACTELGIMADETVKRAKLLRLRPGFDFRSALDRVMKLDDMTLLEALVKPVLGIKSSKTFHLGKMEDMLLLPAQREEKAELVSDKDAQEILFEDEAEDKRIRGNYGSLMRLLLSLLMREARFDLRRFNEYAISVMGDRLFANSDYYSFLIHLCQKREYVIDSGQTVPETFLDEMLKDCVSRPEYEPYLGMGFVLELAEGQEDTLRLGDDFEVTNIVFRRV